MGELAEVNGVPEERIRLLPTDGVQPRPSRLPLPWARRWRSSFEEGMDPSVSVFVAPRAYVRFCAHAGSDLEQEVGGALLGTWRQDRATGHRFIIVEAVLRGRFTRQGRAHVTFTQDTLVGLHDEMEERYPGKLFVGWYHTHPGLGVFLSGYDTWLHEHFFPEPWQVALVMDPCSPDGGFFVREKNGDFDPRRYAGFFELLCRRGESVVHWRNLSPLGEPGETT